jgi:hypothetical protein
MLKKTLMAGAAAALLLGLPVATLPVMAQPAPTAVAPSADSIKADKLIGHAVVNPQNEKVGDINSVYIDKSGKIDSVIVGVGGFIGIGEREVAMKWSDLKVTDNGDKIVVNATKDQLKAMPEYKYTDKTYRGHVFSDTGVGMAHNTAPATGPATNAPTVTGANPPATMPNSTATHPTTVAPTSPTTKAEVNTTTRPAAPPADRTTTDTRRNTAIAPNGNMSANAIIGADVRNKANETIGKVTDLYVGKDGAVKGVVVGVGGFLGVGEHNVMLSWDKVQLREDRDHNGVVLNTDATKDSLKAMPEYKL